MPSPSLPAALVLLLAPWGSLPSAATSTRADGDLIAATAADAQPDGAGEATPADGAEPAASDAVEPSAADSAEAAPSDAAEVEAPAPEATEEPDTAAVEPSVATSAPTGKKPTPSSAFTGKRGILRKHRFVYDNLITARVNPLGLANRFRFGYRYQLVNRDTALFRDSFVALKLYTFNSPAFGRVGPLFEIQPAAIINMSVSYEFIGYYGTFDAVNSFETATAEHFDDTLEDRTSRGENNPTIGSVLTASLQLQAKAGPVAVRNATVFPRYDLNLPEGDTVFYEQFFDIMVPNGGWMMFNDLDLLLVLERINLTLGARYTASVPFYEDRHFLASEVALGENVNLNGPQHRVGPAVIYKFFSRPGNKFDEPTLVLLTQWWVKHRYRTGQEVSQAFPLILIAFTFKGDFL